MFRDFGLQWDRATLTVALLGGLLAGIAVALPWASPLLPSAVAAGALAMIGSLYRPAAKLRILERAGAILLGGALFLSSWTAVRPIPALTAADVLFLLAAGLAVIVCVASPKRLAAVPFWLWTSLAILLGSALLVELVGSGQQSAAANLISRLDPSQALESQAAGNLGYFVRFAVALGVVPMLLVVLGTTWKRVAVLGDLWVAGVAVSAGIACLDYAQGSAISTLITGLGRFGEDDTLRAAGLTTHPNILGVTCAMALPLAVVRIRGLRGRAAVVPMLVVVPLVVGVGVSGSRAALIGACIGMVAVAVYDRGTRRFLMTRVLPVLALAAAISASLLLTLPAVERTLDPIGSKSALSDLERAAVTSTVTEEIAERPLLGYGYQNLRIAHNIYLQVLHSGGVIALLGFGYYICAALWTASKRRRALDSRAQLLLAGASGSVIAWLAIGFVQNPIFDRFLYVPVGLLVTLQAVSRQDGT